MGTGDLTSAMKLRATPDYVTLGFAGLIGQTASAHHFGQEDFVGRTKDGRAIRTKYPERRLLGFGVDDIYLITDAALKMLED